MKTTSFLLLVVLMFISIGCDGTVESKTNVTKLKAVVKPEIGEAFTEEPKLEDLIGPEKKSIKLILVKPPEVKKEKIKVIVNPSKPKKKKRVKLGKGFKLAGMYKENGCTVKIWRKDFIETALYTHIDCNNVIIFKQHKDIWR